MTPQERFERHEQWLPGHERALARHDEYLSRADALFGEVGEIQRRQAALMPEIAQKHVELAERVDAVIAVIERYVSSRGKESE